MTWNIHGGIGRDRRHDFERILSVVRRADPDILALQEVDSRGGRGIEHPLAVLRRTLGHHGVSATAIVTPDGDYGQALLSRWPMTDTEVHDISVAGREPRRAVSTVVNSPAGTLNVIATHLGLRFLERRQQCTTLVRLSERSDLTTVMLGDFNDWIWPGSVQNALAARLPARSLQRTFPARCPLLRLDRIYCRPASAFLRSWIPEGDTHASDHLPLMAEIDALAPES